MLILDTDLQLFLGKMFNLHTKGTKDRAERLRESRMRYFEQKKKKKKCSAENIVVGIVFAYIWSNTNPIRCESLIGISKFLVCFYWVMHRPFLLLVWIEAGTAAASRALAHFEQKPQQNHNCLGNLKTLWYNYNLEMSLWGSVTPWTSCYFTTVWHRVTFSCERRSYYLQRTYEHTGKTKHFHIQQMPN